jgi:fructose-bisphosphate aldolase class I
MNKLGPLPLKLTFSYGRALKTRAAEDVAGKSENIAAAQRAFTHRAKLNGLATRGQWKSDLKKKAA